MLDGPEVVVLLVSKHSPLLKVSDVVLLLNIAIFGIAACICTLHPTSRPRVEKLL